MAAPTPRKRKANGPASTSQPRQKKQKTNTKTKTKTKKRKTSGFRGVFWNKKKARWLAEISHQGKNKRLGRFVDEEEAARAYDAGATKLKGANATLNFPKAPRCKTCDSPALPSNYGFCALHRACSSGVGGVGGVTSPRGAHAPKELKELMLHAGARVCFRFLECESHGVVAKTAKSGGWLACAARAARLPSPWELTPQAQTLRAS